MLLLLQPGVCRRLHDENRDTLERNLLISRTQSVFCITKSHAYSRAHFKHPPSFWSLCRRIICVAKFALSWFSHSEVDDVSGSSWDLQTLTHKAARRSWVQTKRKNPHKPHSSACCCSQWTSPMSVCPEAQQLILGSTEWRGGNAGSIVTEDAAGCANVCMYRGQTSSHWVYNATCRTRWMGKCFSVCKCV